MYDASLSEHKYGSEFEDCIQAENINVVHKSKR